MKSFNRQTLLILGSVFLLGLGLRLVWLPKHPSGLTPDEAAQGYTAYSILKTGRDEWGVKIPLNPRSFGDFKPPLQTYLMIPSVAVFGLNEFAVRLPNAFLGSLAIVGIFLLSKELFGNQTVALLASLLLAFSPWHLSLSRGAFESNLTVFFISFGIYFLLKAFASGLAKWQFLAALFLGLNMFSYHSAKLITPLIVLLFFAYQLLFSKFRFKRVWPRTSNFLVIFFVFLALALASFLSGGQKRGLDIAVFNPTDKWQTVKDERWWAVTGMKIPDFVARLFHNKINYSLKEVFRNYLSYFSPQFLFSEGPGEATYGMIPGRGVLWWWELPLVLFGLYCLTKRNDKTIILLILLILISPLPASLAKGTYAAGRVAIMMPWIQIFTAWCFWQLFSLVKQAKRLKNLFFLTFSFLALISFFFFLEDYFIQSPRVVSKEMLYGRCQALRLLAGQITRAKAVVVSRKLSEPQAYVMFCLKYPPLEVQKEVPFWLEYQSRGLSFVDQLGEYWLGKFTFRELNWTSDSLLEDTVLIGLPAEFPEKISGFVRKEVFYPGDGPAVSVLIKEGGIE